MQLFPNPKNIRIIIIAQACQLQLQGQVLKSLYSTTLLSLLPGEHLL